MRTLCTLCVVCVLQVRLAIAEKGLQCKEYDVSLPLSEHNEPWFMRLNPAGEVPVLVHDDRVICDPTQIMDYLEETFNDGKRTKLSCNVYYEGLGSQIFKFIEGYVIWEKYHTSILDFP